MLTIPRFIQAPIAYCQARVAIQRATIASNLGPLKVVDAPPHIDCRVDEKRRYVMQDIAQEQGYRTDGKIYTFAPSRVEYVLTSDPVRIDT